MLPIPCFSFDGDKSEFSASFEEEMRTTVARAFNLSMTDDSEAVEKCVVALKQILSNRRLVSGKLCF